MSERMLHWDPEGTLMAASKTLITNDEHLKVPAGSKRSSRWPSVRRAHLKKNPACAVCGSKKNLEVHHKMPFHLDPGLELNPDNLITLCESKGDGVNCHLLFGHLGSFKSFNQTVEQDAKDWNTKLGGRPR